MLGKTLTAATLAFGVTAGAASAASITVQTFTQAAYDAYVASLSGAVVEDFESFGYQEYVGGVNTAVGDFATIGGVGSGSTIVGTATDVAVKSFDGTAGGRSNTTVGGSQWLDSNDTFGIAWDVDTGSLFNSVGFTVSDAADRGATLNISAGGVTEVFANAINASVEFVIVSFDSRVSSASLVFENLDPNNQRTNDGFGIDDATAGVAPIPLPASIGFMLAGLGGLTVLRRRK